MQTVTFSNQTRTQNLNKLNQTTFDFLIIGGGITGASVLRDLALKGYSCALVEKNDFAYGTSSRSSKLIHGGLRYLENFEFRLVFEALKERTLLLKTAPNLIKPLVFYMPTYKKLGKPRFMLNIGLWLYDILALFRATHFHKSLSRKKFLEKVPFIQTKNLTGGFSYYDAQMMDDVMVVDVLRDAQSQSPDQVLAINYCEAQKPIWQDNKITGFEVFDRKKSQNHTIKAKNTIVCAGPWTDNVAKQMDNQWQQWLEPSKGVHLIFDLSKIPVPGCVVMMHPEDGRISFVIPRPDMGFGVAVVGTTDSAAPKVPDDVQVDSDDVTYLMDLLNLYFPKLQLSKNDIIGSYVGIRPLVGNIGSDSGDNQSLQKISREHHIGDGPGQTTVVAGGKYTTCRTMAEEIVDFALKKWSNQTDYIPPKQNGKTKDPFNQLVLESAQQKLHTILQKDQIKLAPKLIDHYGLSALDVYNYQKEALNFGIEHPVDPKGFPLLAGQFLFGLRHQMVVSVIDFITRRQHLYLTRADGGKPWLDYLVELWAIENKVTPEQKATEHKKVLEMVNQKETWLASLHQG